MRKAEKRRLGRKKQEQNLRQVLASGWEAQKQDQEARDRRHQEALIARDSRTKSQETANGPKSKIAQEKRERVAKRLEEKEQMGELDLAYEQNFIALNDMDDIQSDLERPDGDLGIVSFEKDRSERLLKAIFMGAGGPVSAVDHDAELDRVGLTTAYNEPTEDMRKEWLESDSSIGPANSARGIDTTIIPARYR